MYISSRNLSRLVEPFDLEHILSGKEVEPARTEDAYLRLTFTSPRMDETNVRLKPVARATPRPGQSHRSAACDGRGSGIDGGARDLSDTEHWLAVDLLASRSCILDHPMDATVQLHTATFRVEPSRSYNVSVSTEPPAYPMLWCKRQDEPNHAYCMW